MSVVWCAASLAPPSVGTTMATTFIGVDLAWQSDRNTSGGVVLRGSRSRAKLDTVSAPLASTDAVLAFVRAHAGDGTVTAIDAPLIMGVGTRC